MGKNVRFRRGGGGCPCVCVCVCGQGGGGCCRSSSFGEYHIRSNNKRGAREKKLFPHKLFSFFSASGPVEQLMKFK